MRPKRHLVKNALGHYYVRIYVPKDLRQLLQKKELRRSLRTTCESTAITRSAEKIFVIKKYFELLREQCGIMIRQDEWALASKMIQVSSYVKETENEKITLENLKTDGTLADRRSLALLIGGEEAQKLLKEVEEEEEREQLADKMRSAATIRSDNFMNKQANIPVLSEYLKLYLERKDGTGRVFKGSTKRKYINAVGLFVDLFGDKSVSRYTERNAMDYRHSLRLLPPKFRLIEPWMSMSIDHIVESELVEKTLSTSTISGYLQCMNSIFTDLDDRRTLIDFNIFKDIKVAVIKTGKFIPFAEHELKELFQKDALPVDNNYPSHFWVPLLALFTGMRRSEIFFRTAGDISVEDDIEYIDINRDDGKGTKNLSSIRKIPIHSFLKRLGFMKYVQEVQDQGGEDARLFPEYNDSGGQAGNKFTDYFIGYRKSRDIVGVGKVFHSFRSNFINELEKRNCNTYHIQQLSGHSLHSITHDSTNGYGGKAGLVDLKETIEQMDFSGVLKDLPQWKFNR